MNEKHVKVFETVLKDLLVFEPEIHSDHRGSFLEIFENSRYSQVIGNQFTFVQDNFSRSYKGVLRGLHFQVNRPQGKLVTVINGVVFDVVVDLRPDSPSYKQIFTIELDSSKGTQLWIPPGMAHGFCVLSDSADFFYKCTEYYAPSLERGVVWNDPELGIEWPVKEPLVSERDKTFPTLNRLLV